MAKSGFWLKTALVGVTLLVLGGCSAIYRDHGYVPTDADLANVIVGVDTQDTVRGTVGQPTASGLLSGGDWYYVQSRWRHYAYRAPKELSREVVAIRFSDSGVVENVERFGLQDGNVVALSRRVTDTNIRGISFLRQLFGNFGNFTADQFLGN